MTALAFLFAVFLARPCPFYILDEVEAALDDLNLDRFLTLLRRYSDRAQFIVITHQKRTMEAADWLYGVSMGEDGVSKVLSRRLPSEQASSPGGGRGRGELRRGPRSSPLSRGSRRARRSAALLSSRAPWPATGANCSSPTRSRRRCRRARPTPRASAGARAQRGGLFRRLRESMAKTRQALGSEIQATLFGVLDEHTWERLEEALIMADVGAAHDRVGGRRRSRRRPPTGKLEGGQALSERLIELLAATAQGRRRTHRHPPAADRDHGRGRQRHRQDDDDRQARLAPARAAGTQRAARRRRTRSGPPPASSSRAGRSAQAARSSPGRRALTPARWPSTRSRRRARGASTW